MLSSIKSTVFNQISGVIFGIINSILITRALGVEGKGLYAIVIANISLFTIIFNLGLPTSTTYFVSSNRINASRLFFTTNIISILLAVAYTSIGFFEVNIFKTDFFLPNQINGWAFLLLLGYFFFLKVNGSFYRAYLFAIQRIDISNILDVIFNFTLSVILSSLLLFTSTFEITFIGFFIILITLQTALTFGQFMVLVKSESIKLEFKLISKTDLLELIKWSGIAYISNIFQFLSYRLDFWIVSYLIGINAVGIYSLSSNLNQMLWLVPNALAAVIMPYIAKEMDKSNSTITTTRIGRLCFIIVLLLAAASNFLSEHFIPILYGDEFAASVFPFQILIYSAAPFALATVYASYFIGINKPKVNMIASLIGFMFTILLDILLIPKIEIYGAAMASSISYVATSIYMIFMFKLYTEQNLLLLFIPSKEDFNFVKKIKIGKHNEQ